MEASFTYPGLHGLIDQLPRPWTGWTDETRVEFLKAFELVLDYSIPIRPKEESNG
jgi:hypothetical protein